MAIELQRVRRPILESPARARKATNSEPAASGLSWSSATFGAKERMFFTERLELLLDTGIPLHSALDTLRAQADTPATRDVIAALQESVAGGATFSAALGRHPAVFPPTYVSLVAAGENGGFLAKVLERLRELDERREELRSSLVSAFTYPAFLVVFSVSVVVFVLVVVFPKFEDIFQQIYAQLPITTRFLMTTSAVLRDHWIPALAGSAAALAAIWWWVKSPRGAETMDRLVQRTPLVRDIAIQFQLVQFLHTMSLSLGNGVPMLDALHASREIAPHGAFRRFIERLERLVSEGQGVSAGFRDAAFLPALVPQMVSTGEESGGLAAVMGRVADFYEREWRKKLTFLAKIVEPTMLLVMGVVVGLIVSSILLPIFKLSTTVH